MQPQFTVDELALLKSACVTAARAVNCDNMDDATYLAMANKISKLTNSGVTTAMTSKREFLHWIVDRLVNVHGENPNFDYMIALRKIADEATGPIP